MNSLLTALIVALSIVAGAVTGSAQTTLTVVRHPDNTIWKRTCDGGGNCSAWSQIPGGFSAEPTLKWDPAIQKYILTGIGNNGSTIWKSTFNADGSWNNDWTKLTQTSPLPVAASGGGFLWVVLIGVIIISTIGYVLVRKGKRKFGKKNICP